MIKNYYWAMAVMAAFVAGTIATATPVFAPPPEDDDALMGWKLAVDELQEQIDTLNVDDNDSDPTNELQILSTTEGSVDLSNGGSSVSCVDITGGAGLCDGIDAVVDADSSTTNEIQTLSETDGTITLSNSGGSVTVQDRVSSNCAPGSSIRAIAADGAVTCETDDSGGFPSRYTVLGTKSILPLVAETWTVSCDTGDQVDSWYYQAGSLSFHLIQATLISNGGSVFFESLNSGLNTHTAFGEIVCFDFGIQHVP